MKKVICLIFATGFLGAVFAVDDLTWTGAASATWNTTDLNWQNAGGTACAWTDGCQAVFPSGCTVTNITVSGEVKPYRLMFAAGQWSFGGNATLRITDGRMGQTNTDPTVGVTFKDGLTVRPGTGVAGVSVDMNLASLTIEHASFLCPSNRFHNNWNTTVPQQARGIITIGDGGNLTAKDLVLSPATTIAGQENYVVNIYTNGVLNLLIGLHEQFKSKYGTIHSDGGAIQGTSFMNASEVTTSTKFSLGPGGVRFTGTGNQRVNSPIEGVGPLLLDSSPIFYFRIYGVNAPVNSHTGGTHILKNHIVVVNNDRNFGAVPDVATNNVFVDVSSATLLAEGATVKFAPTRGFALAADSTLNIGGNGGGLIFRGPITGTNHNGAANGTISTATSSWTPTHLAIEPAAGVTNRFGRLLVNGRDLIVAGEGVTEVNAKITKVEQDAGSLVIKGVKLSVTNGLLSVVNATYIGNRGHVMVSGGVADFSRITSEYLNAFRLPGTTTVCRAGTMLCNNFRMGEDQTSPEKALLRMEKGGTLLCNNFVQSFTTNLAGAVTDLTTSGQIDWDGGIIAPRGTAEKLNFLGIASRTGQIEAWKNRVKVYVREGGAVVSNNCEIRIRLPLQHGVAEGLDGGFTKWGSAMMAFVGTPDEGQESFNTFNGPINVEQGKLTMGSASNFLPTVALNVRSGATFNGNTMPQTFASIGGTGTVQNPSSLTVTDALAPGYGTNTIGTLTVDGALAEVKDGAELQIDLDEDGHSDCLSYAGALDLAKLRLVVNDTTKLNTDCKYTIATGLTSCANAFASANLPNGWIVLQSTSGGTTTLKLAFLKGTTIIMR